MDMKAHTPVEVEPVEVESNLSIGSILVRQGRLSPHDVDPVLKYAAENGLRFGESAVNLRLVRSIDVDEALARQFSFPVTFAQDLGVSEEVVTAHDPGSSRLESIRALRSELMIRQQAASQLRSFAVVSTDRGEGRSWLAANLAVAFAQAGERTLLVDGDLRNPRQHKLFNVRNSLGLSGLLSRRADASTIHRLHPDLRLFLITAGVMPPNPQELLAQSRSKTIFNRFAQQFSVVIYDTPSIFDSADAQMLSARAGAAILVARHNRTRYSRLTAATQGLAAAGVNIIGSVLNDF
jgi:protein-tyrosine kinase